MTKYLGNRKSVIMVNGKLGGDFCINIGVPQGSVLGPTLFKIYIMDLHCHSELFCVKFADDSSFEGSGNTRDEVESLMNTELEKINEWFRLNKLTLHPDKSKYLIHSRDKLINLKIGNKGIKRCGYGLQEESVCLLGIQIDENLDWKEHIAKVKKKVSKGNYLLWRHGKKMSLNMKKLIYESFVRCHLLYCLPVWGGAKLTILKPLNKLLHKTWAKIGKRKSHTLTRLRHVQILKLEDELFIQESKIIWNWENNLLPKSLLTLIEEKVDRLRGRRFKILRHVKTGSINHRLTKMANTSIGTIASAKTKTNLIKDLKNNILTNKYNFNCNKPSCFICRNST